MEQNLSSIDAVRIIQSAFAPLRCLTEGWDYDHRVRFQVFKDQAMPLFTEEHLLKSQFSHKATLKASIICGRENLLQQGFVLDDWTV